MTEIWKPLVGFEDCYSISDQGRVARTMTYGKDPKPMWRLLARRVKRDGYLTYHLCKGGKRTDPTAHRLVWRTFVGEVPEGFEINHINSRRDDARLDNLELMTRSQNAAYAFSHNGRPAPCNPLLGSNNRSARLKEADIPVIRAALKAGEFQYVIAKRYGVSQPAIGAIATGKTWRHVPDH